MTLYKILWTDGYNRETVSDYIVEENMCYNEAVAYCDALRNVSNYDGDWWIVVDQRAHVWQGMAEFV